MLVLSLTKLLGKIMLLAISSLFNSHYSSFPRPNFWTLIAYSLPLHSLKGSTKISTLWGLLRAIPEIKPSEEY